MSTVFDTAFARTMQHEGGYTDSGPTYMGIDRRYWPAWPGWLLVDDWCAGIIDVLARDTACAPLVVDFYRQHFWGPMRGDEMAAIDLDIACKVFDTEVHCGTGDGVRHLQTALNRLNRHGKTYSDLVVDGKMGNRTLQTMRRCLQTVYGGDPANAKRLIMICLAGEKYIHLTNLVDHESWPGWFLRLSFAG